MIPAIPLAYAARHLYPEHPFAPPASGGRPLPTKRRRGSQSLRVVLRMRSGLVTRGATAAR